MNHPWCTAIIPQSEQEDVKRSFNRLQLTIMMATAVVSQLPEYIDAKVKAA